MDVKTASGPLVDVVGRYVRLQRRGRISEACCPFHQERTPSFVVYPDHFHCYGCGAHGDVFDFVARAEGRQLGDVMRQMRNQSGVGATPSPEARARIRLMQEAAEAASNEPDPYEIVSPVPAGVPPLWQGGGQPTARILKPGAALGEALSSQLPVEAVHEYRGYHGELRGFVVRTPRNRRTGKKGAHQVAWARNVRLADGSVTEGWTFVSYPEPRAVYGAPLVTHAREEGKPLRYLIVEGEKCQEAGQASDLARDWIVVSWVGGSNAWLRTDWALIAEGDEVALWPDADESGVGHATMVGIGQHLIALGCRNLKWITPPPAVPNKWDVANAIRDNGWTGDRLRAFVAAGVPWTGAVEPPPPAEAAPVEPLVPGLPPEPSPRERVLSVVEQESLVRFGSRLRQFSTVVQAPPPQLQFTLPGFLRGTVGMVVGAGGSGKSFAMLQTMICLAAGLDIWGLWSDLADEIMALPSPPGRCIYVAAEDPAVVVDWRTHHLGLDAIKRIKGSRHNLDEVLVCIDRNLQIFPVYGAGRENAFALAGSRTETSVVPGPLYENLMQYGRGALAIGLDTLGRVSSTLEEKEGSDMGQIIDIAETLTVETAGANVLFAHHTTKAAALNGQAQEQQAVSGSRKLTDHARWQVNMAIMDAKTGEARALTDADRRRWINVAAAKMNYADNAGARWWRRGEHGILVGGYSPPEQQQRQPNLAGGSVSPKAGSSFARMSREVAGE
ncbi:AAA family ATPase [Paeniroseomonas aquatica]|uniref:AAA family ATPase n=1 Tax=Paeniroseomonas aquatica TaxID=373043 RepID=A0ABT8A0J7_9PROT|nr:CHC2 zinc finger domain-containing protein [Paeniroseomonas aquatica]MDN3563146.1 AAA family ATPase [Paeniroseomonas aquatica]